MSVDHFLRTDFASVIVQATMSEAERSLLRFVSAWVKTKDVCRHADDPGGDPEVTDKEEVRYPSLDLILQDGATSHMARATQQWREVNCPAFFYKEGWPLFYPSLKSLGCSLWMLLEKETSVKPHQKWAN